ncbi:hypothetical protein ACLB2K_051043 [Fragaria x ananassa]
MIDQLCSGLSILFLYENENGPSHFSLYVVGRKLNPISTSVVVSLRSHTEIFFSLSLRIFIAEGIVAKLAEALAFTEDEVVVDFGDVGAMAVEKELHHLMGRMLPPREANARGLPRNLASLWGLGDQISISQAGDRFILRFRCTEECNGVLTWAPGSTAEGLCCSTSMMGCLIRRRSSWSWWRHGT